MNKIIALILVATQFTLTLPAVAKLSDFDRALTSAENRLVNPGFESSTAAWVASTSSHLAKASGAANIGTGSGAVTWSPTASSETFQSGAVLVSSGDGLSGQTGGASCRVKWVSGSTSLTIEAYDGTNHLGAQAVTLPTGWTRIYASDFSIPASGNFKLQLISGGAQSIDVDDCYLGLGEGLPGGPVKGLAGSDWKSFTPTINGLGGGYTTTTLAGAERRVGDTVEVSVFWQGTTGTGTGDLTIPPPSDATPNTSLYGASSAYAIPDGFMVKDTSSAFGSQRAIFYSGGLFYARDTSTSNLGGAGATIVRFYAKYKVAGWSANVTMAQGAVEYAYNSDTSNASTTSSGFQNGEGGTQFGSFTGSVTKRVRFLSNISPNERVIMEIKQNNSWLPLGSNSALVSPYSGSDGVYVQPVSGSNTDVDVIFGASRTTASGQTWAEISGSDTYKWRLVKTKNAITIGMDSKQVISNQTNERIERATVVPASSSSCTVSSQSGSWISAATPNSAGDCTLTISGFSTTPTCVATALVADTPVHSAKIYSASSTSVRVQMTYQNGATTNVTPTGETFNIICMGPR